VSVISRGSMSWVDDLAEERDRAEVRTDRRVAPLLVLVSIGFLGLAWNSPWSFASSNHSSVETVEEAQASADPLLFGRRVDINTATFEVLITVPGIGPGRAAAILEDRRTKGAFGSVDDVTRVRGIGPKTLAPLRPFLEVGAASRAAVDTTAPPR
jgi:competence ComEA-like helix-hairpin-helix protein